MKRIRKITWAKHQKRWFGKWHTYLGILAGAVIVIIGLTGSLLVFREEIEEILNPGLNTVPLRNQKSLDIGELVRATKARYPAMNFWQISRVSLENGSNVVYSIYDPVAKEVSYFNPYTAEKLARPTRHKGEGFMNLVTEIHHELLLEEVGQYIVGAATLILIVLTISGLRLWIPRKWNQVKSVLTIDFGAGFKRQNLDWHNVVGFYSSPVILLLALSGLCLTIMFLTYSLSSSLGSDIIKIMQPQASLHSVEIKDKQPLPVDSVLVIAKRALPQSRVFAIGIPQIKTAIYSVRLLPLDSEREVDRQELGIEQYSGKVLYNSESDQTGFDKALEWVSPIHYGSFGGLPTKILAFMGGLAPLALFITGFLIWWPRVRRQKERQSKMKPGAEQANPITESNWGYFWLTLKKGLIYALWFVVTGGIMGALYGLPAGTIIEPAAFTIVITSVLAAINFLVAVLVVMPNLFLLPFRRSYRPLTRYFALSLGFVIVFAGAYQLLVNSGLKVF